MIENKFTCIQTLGSGAQAKVKLARDNQNKQVAIKIFKLDQTNNDSPAMRAIEAEVSAYKALMHPNIVQLYDFVPEAFQVHPDGREERVAFMVMEYVSGGSLINFLLLRKFEPPITRFYFKQLLKALFHAH